MSNFTLEKLPSIEPSIGPVEDVAVHPEATELLQAEQLAPIQQEAEMERYLGVLARRAAVERYNSEIAASRRESDGELQDHVSNEWYYKGMNATRFDDELDTAFRLAYTTHYAYLTNPDR